VKRICRKGGIFGAPSGKGSNTASAQQLNCEESLQARITAKFAYFSLIPLL
jgi:hypothetical protein